jgi:hypothetical protein
MYHVHVTIFTFSSCFLSKTTFALLYYFPWSAVKSKGTAIPVQAWTGPYGSKRLRLPQFLDNRHIKMARLSALPAAFTPEVIPGTHFCRLSQLQGHSVARKIKPLKNSKDHIGNRNRDLMACSAGTQPSVLSCTTFQVQLCLLLRWRLSCCIHYTYIVYELG